MSLTLPTVDEFFDFWGNEADEDDAIRAQVLIELARNLFVMASGITDDPTDTIILSMIKFALMDMAIFLYITRENIDAQYSPFVSERIGSYSYAKSYSRTNAAITAGHDTGAALFDALIEYLNLQAMGSWLSSETVFEYGFIPNPLMAWLQDPSSSLSLSSVYARRIQDHTEY